MPSHLRPVVRIIDYPHSLTPTRINVSRARILQALLNRSDSARLEFTAKFPANILPTMATTKVYEDYCQAIEHPQMINLELKKATGLSMTTLAKCLKEIDTTLLSKRRKGRNCIYTLLSTGRARELIHFTVVGRKKAKQVARLRRLGLDPVWLWPRRGRKPKFPSMRQDVLMVERLRKLPEGALRYLNKQAPGFTLVPNNSQGDVIVLGYNGRRIPEIKQMIPKAMAHYRLLHRLNRPPASDTTASAAWEPDDKSISEPNFEGPAVPSTEEQWVRFEEATQSLRTGPHKRSPEQDRELSAS